MSIYASPEKETRWIFRPVRESFSGVGREEKIRASARMYGLKNISVVSKKNALFAAYSVEKDGYDFAMSFAAYCEEKAFKDVVYVERKSDWENVIVIIKDGLIKQDKVGSKGEIEKNLRSLVGSVGIGNMKVINYRFFASGNSGNIEKYFEGKIESISVALTDSIVPTEEVKYLPEREAMAKLKTRRPRFLYIALVSLLVFGIGELVGSAGEEVNKEVVEDPYEGFFNAIESEVVEISNRMKQDYNVHVKLMLIAGWSVVQVSHTKGQVSYRVLPSEKGDLGTLKKFADNNGLHVLIDSKATVLLGVGANVAAHGSAKAKIYDVIEVHHFLRDAVNVFIPGAEVVFVRDVPKGAQKGAQKKWVVRELSVQFRGIYKEDLITLGSITSDLPVSLGGDSSDPNAGQYIVDKERFTGGLKISIYGDKK